MKNFLLFGVLTTILMVLPEILLDIEFDNHIGLLYAFGFVMGALLICIYGTLCHGDK